MSAPGRPSRDTVAFINEAISQWDDGIEDVGYVARVFASTSLPYRDPGDALPVWQRENGALTLSIQPGPPLRQPGGTYKPTGYPYGSMPRLLLAWLGTEAVRRKERTIPLGESLADFCRQLDIPTNGGANGSLTRLKDQARRLLRARISVDYNESIGDLRQEAASFLQIADRYDLWWNDDPGSQGTLLPSYIELSEQFFTEITERPVPIDLRTLQLLRGAPLRLDIYIWLTYRMSYLRRPSIVTWPQLIAQFGSQAATKQAQRKFKIDFMNHLAQVLAAYPGARVEEHAHGLRLLPGAPAVGRGNRRVLNVPDREVYNPSSARPLDGLLRLTKSRAGKEGD